MTNGQENEFTRSESERKIQIHFAEGKGEEKKEEKCKMFSNLAVKFICHVALKFFFPF